MINFRHITLASNFYTTKFSANRQNTEYTVGNRTDRIVQGTPSVLYDEVVFCKELKIIYTHGAFYEANSAQFDLDAFVTKGELIDNYVNKTDLDNYYTKPQTDNTFVKKSTLENNYYDKDTTFDLFVTKNRLISDYFNKSDIEENYYTKRQTNNLLDQKQDIISGEGVISVEDNVVKADLSDYYNKSEVDTKLDQKQDIISGEGVISVENNVVKADLSDYYDKSEVYTKQETDNLLDQKQDIISGEGVISVENNVVSADLSDYYNKETVDNKLATKQNLISGNPGEVLYHNGSDVFTQEVLGENLVVTTQTDLDKCKNISPSFKTVLESWQRFSHLNGVNNAKPADLSGWEYLEDLNTVRQNNNSESYAGFISPKSYSNYELTIRVFSDDTVVNDDDSIGLVAAFAKDSNGREHTLSFIRSIGTSSGSTSKISIRWVCVLDYCAFALDSTANGQKILANKSTAVPTASGIAKWADVPTGSVIYVKREGNVFTAKCSNFNSRTLVEESTMTINLDTLTENGQNTTLNLFKGSSPWGYSTFSQAHSMYENISVVDPSFVIFDLVNSAVLTFDSATSSWVPVAGQNPIELLGAGRFSYNNVTNKLFYNNGTSVIELTSKYYAGSNIEIEDNTISATIDTDDLDLSDYYKKSEINTKLTNYYTKSEVNSEFDNLSTVASTGSYNDLVDTPELQNLTAGENIEITDSVISAVDTKYTAGEGIEIDEDNKISLVQEEKITEKPAEDDQEANVFYNYNGVKVVVPRGNGYFNLFNNYVVPDSEGDQLFPKGLYIQDDTRSITEIDASIYELWAGIKKSSYILEFNEDLVAEVMELGYTTISNAETKIKNTLDLYYMNNCFSNSIDAKINYECIFSELSNGDYDPLLLRLPLSNRVFSSSIYYYHDQSEVPSNLQIIQKGDYFYDLLGNLYTVSSVGFSSSNILFLSVNFSGILSKKTADSFSITLEETSPSSTTDSVVNIINRYVGEEIVKVKLPTTVSATAKLDSSSSSYSDNPATSRKPYRVTCPFKGFYKNSNDQYCYVYGPSESETINIAMTKRLTQLRNQSSSKQLTLTFCGFLTFGTPYSIELPIQYTTDDTEIQGFNWTSKETSIDDILSDTSINAVQNKVITTELAKIRTEFVPHYIELPNDGNKGDIVQYIGYTDNYFTNGYFYKYDNIIIPPNTNYISLNNDYPKFKRGVYTEIESPTNFSSLGIVQVISDNFYGDYTIAEGQDEYGTLSNFPSIRFDFFGVPDKTDGAELMKGLDYIQVGELAADEAGNLYRISEVDPNYRNFIIKVKLEIYRLAYDFTLKRNSEPDVTYKLSNVLSQILSETWISIVLTSSTSIQYSLFKTFANYRGDTIYAYKYSSGTSMTGPMYCCSTKLVDGVVRPTFAGFLYWSNWVQTIYIETGSLTIKPQIYTSGNVSVTSEHLGWSQIDVQPNDGGTDLSNYYTKPEVNSLLANKQGTLSSGDAIEITNDTISVTVDDALSTDSENPVQNKVVTSSLSSKVSNLGGVSNMLALTENEYNALETKDSNTLYIIVDD